ncbi:hypothetical protein VTN00DRAFT_10395 [Thermoascus crustaceus]|uniref:uncharacterized protein n=1 Tax=Thermoascus crustaceus TaxID=5088 RepID=UPI0037446E35
MAEACAARTDNVFGPAVSCPTTFDFTLLFEQSILSIGPSTLFLLLVPLQLLRLYRTSIKTVPNIAYWIKLTVAIALLGLQVTLLILWAHHDTIQTAIPAAALSLTTALAIVILSAFGHNRSGRPSSLLSIYLLASIFLDAVQARTLFIRRRPSSIAATFTAGLVVKVLLLAVESRSKRGYLRKPYRRYPPESTSGIFNRTVLWWFNSLFIGGCRKILSLEDLFSPDDTF